MKTSARWLTALALGAALLIAAPLVYAGSGGNDRGFGWQAPQRVRRHGWSDPGGKHGGRAYLDVVGLTSNQKLICFEEDDPNDAEKIGGVSGLSGDDRLVGIDYRPATGDSTASATTAASTCVDDHSAQATPRSPLDAALERDLVRGRFQPGRDRLRVVSDTGQNLRRQRRRRTTTG